MAVIGQALAAPEAGWKRYENTAPQLTYGGVVTWNVTADAGCSGGSQSTASGTVGTATISFKFRGTKIRLTGYGYDNRAVSPTITIDGVTETFKENYTSGAYSVLMYEKTGLVDGEHTVLVQNPNNGTGSANYLTLDALDIDSTGSLMYATEKTALKDMVVGDRIVCRYTANANTFGSFSELGTTATALIPVASTANPDGAFYWICVGKDNLGRLKLIADRNIQHSISWDTLNTAGVATGSGVSTVINPKSDIPTISATDARITSYGGAVANGEDWRAFDGVTTTRWIISGTSGWIAYDFGSPTTIQSYSIQGTTGGAGRNPKSWTFEGWDGSAWVVIDTRTNITSWVQLAWAYFEVTNPGSYTKYRLNITANNGDTYIDIPGLGMSSSKGDARTVRLLTGGVSTSDTDNEWDKIIVSSTLNGTITAGADAVWNYSVATRSWTSTVNPGNSAQRIERGYSNNVTAWNYNGTSGSAVNDGLRPVLLVELPPPPPPNKFLVQDGTDLKTYSGGWKTVGTAPATEAMFTGQGMDSLDEALPHITELTNPSLLFYTTTTLKASAVLIPQGKLILPTGDIDLTTVVSTDHFTLLANTGGGGVVKVIASVDSGATWQAWDGSVWQSVVATTDDVAIKGMTPSVFNALTQDQWAGLIGASKKIRFGYYLDVSASTDVANTDQLVGQFNMQGWWEGAIQGTHWNYRFPDNTTLRIMLYADGSYKINYTSSL